MRLLWEGQTYSKNTTSPLNLCYILKRGLDLSILKIWGLLVKGLQSYQLSKLEVTRKSLPTGPGPSRTSWPMMRVVPGSNHSQNLMAGHFAALWPTDPKFSALKELSLFQTMSNIQEASSISRVGFALLKWPHFHRACLVNYVSES